MNKRIAEINSKLYAIGLNLAKKQTILENQVKERESSAQRFAEINNELAKQEAAKKPTLNKPKDVEENKISLEKLESEINRVKGVITKLVEQRRSLDQEKFEATKKIHGLESMAYSSNQEINTLDLEKTKIETRKEDLESEIELSKIEVASGSYSVLDQSEKDLLRARIENLRRKKEATSGVDPETVKEYQELEVRVTEMKGQLEDLIKAKHDLEEIINSLDVRIKNQFSKAFSKIAEEFNRFFTVLFDGGKAQLVYEKDEDGNFGIGISANPPGKKLSSLNVLSGGERTLTSLALLFAILSVNPSSFCVLDEVDAALDESNTLRFVRILANLAVKTQFVIISHNRETMKAADLLYGITMNENHMSKLISVRLNEAESLAA